MVGKKVAVFHPGTQHSWQTAQALASLDLLKWYATSIIYQPDAFPFYLERLPGPVGAALKREFSRFKGLGLDPAQLKTFGWHEWVERFLTRFAFNKAAERMDRWGNRAFGRALASEIASPEPFHLWGYDNSSLAAFEAGERAGRVRILDRTFGDLRAYNRDMLDLRETYGDWFTEGGELFNDKQIAVSLREHELANHILVGSPFAARTVVEWDTPAVAAKVEVLEYCFDARNYAAIPAPKPVARDRPVKFLHLGLVNARKGIQHTLEAIRQLPESDATLTVVGKIGVPPHMLAGYADRITYIPTVPRQDVARIMAEHDVFILPTHFEGAGIVLYEALACGLALIQTDRAAAAVTSDTGIMLARPDTELLVEAMRKCIDDRDQLDFWRSNAQQEAKKYDFAGYCRRIASLLERIENAPQASIG